MITITRSFGFDAGHRIPNHESKCRHFHGHRYTAELTFTAPSLDKLGRVIDFGVIKDVCGKWIDDKLDHGMILFKDDPLAKYWHDPRNSFCYSEGDNLIEELMRYYLMDKIPTAENIAEEIYRNCAKLINVVDSEVFLMGVKLWETPNCFAVYAP